MATFLITLLKVGSISFGGHASLVAVLQRELAEKKIFPEEDVLEFFTIASVLPGPVAVNVVACVGYPLYGWWGVFLSIAAILLPSVFILTFFYVFANRFTSALWLNEAVNGVLPIIAAVVLSSGYDMMVRQCKLVWQYLLFGAIVILLIFNHTLAWVLVYFFTGGITAYFFRNSHHNCSYNPVSVLQVRPQSLAILFLAMAFIMTLDSYFKSESVKLLSVFSRLSVTLFGGGYIIIPLLKEIFVENFNWISLSDFNQGVVFSQVTPGPILIVSTYIGMVKAGVVGALVSTFGMFIPSALVSITVASYYGKLARKSWFQSVPVGLRITGIALMVYASVVILNPQTLQAVSLSVFALSLLFIRFTRINYLVLMLIGAVLGIYL